MLDRSQVMDMIEPLGVAQTDDLPFNLSPPSETSKPSHAMHARLGKLTRFASANESASELQRARAAEAKKECCEQKNLHQQEVNWG